MGCFQPNPFLILIDFDLPNINEKRLKRRSRVRNPKQKVRTTPGIVKRIVNSVNNTAQITVAS
jgi:hypothetical protein